MARLFAHLRRRPSPPIDATGPATTYSHHAGALSPTAVRHIEALRRAGVNGPTAVDQACDPWTGHHQRGTR